MKQKAGTGKRAKWGEVLAAKTEDLDSIPGAHMVELL